VLKSEDRAKTQNIFISSVATKLSEKTRVISKTKYFNPSRSEQILTGQLLGCASQSGVKKKIFFIFTFTKKIFCTGSGGKPPENLGFIQILTCQY